MSQLFSVLEERRPGLASRLLVAVAGDVSLPGLGLSPADRALLQDKVSVVFHGAATVRFDEPLQSAVIINVRGTRELAELAVGMKRLKVGAPSARRGHLHLRGGIRIVYPPGAHRVGSLHIAILFFFPRRWCTSRRRTATRTDQTSTRRCTPRTPTGPR